MTQTPLAVAVLTTQQMADVDHRMIAAGIPERVLVDRAGAAVADAAEALWHERGDGRDILVLCGPGNNGADGLVAAQRLRARGLPVRVALLGPVDAVKAGTHEALAAWRHPVEDASRVDIGTAGLVVDALFGAGLNRPLDGAAGELVSRLNAAARPVLAVDIPSGVAGDTGAASGPAVRARETVTFFRRKPGHLLLPGRAHCGVLRVADIGIDPDVLAGIAPRAFANDPPLWVQAFPWPAETGHKYSRGHALVVSGGATTSGAARMSARAALRVGAGLVTLASPSDALGVNAAHQTAVMLHACDHADELRNLLADARKNVVVIGPGAGVGAATRELVAAALHSGSPGGQPRHVVLDADALMSFAGDAGALAALVAGAPGSVVATPHDGEYARLFKQGREGSRLDRARAGAAELGATLVLKGPDTVVASPDGRAAIAHADAPFLATAGSGDVLAGLIGGLLAQGMPAFEAASAAVHLHAAAARRFGPGLIAEDLPEQMPAVLGDLRALLAARSC